MMQNEEIEADKIHISQVQDRQLRIHDDTQDHSNDNTKKLSIEDQLNQLINHSCDVEELKSILKSSEHDAKLLELIHQANNKQRNRPNAYFSFPGTKGSMMSLPPFQKWPTQLGWSFSTWFYLDPKPCAQPYLYNFKTGKSGLGYSAHFTGNCLVLTSIRFKGKGVQQCVAYEFPSHKWMHCAITYHNKWRSSEIKVYVNGQLTANIDMPWQVQTTELFDKCFIGGSGSINDRNIDRIGELNSFCGQMSAIYLFSEGLSATQICALHRLGPSYMGQFKYSNESHVNLPPQICKTLYEEKLASTLCCLFTPAAVDSGTLCIQLAPFKSSTSVSAQNYFVSAPHAALLGETKAIISQPVSSTLQSLGCSRSLLPILDVYAQRGDSGACASLISFICDLLESSPHWFANEIVQNNGFVLIACSLSNNPRQLLTDKLVDTFLNLTRTLLSTSSTTSDSLLLKHLIDNIIFNPSLWIYAQAKLQIKLYGYLANELLHGSRHSLNKYTICSSGISASHTNQATAFQVPAHDETGRCVSDQSSPSPIVADLLFGEIRRVSTVLQSLHALKYYYWHVEEKGISHRAKNYNLRPSREELSVIRSNILAFTRELIARANTTPLDETQGLLNYLSSCSEAENLLDVLDMLSTLIAGHPIPMVAALNQKQAVRVLLTLIGSPSEAVRIKSIRLLSLFLSNCSYKKKHEIMGPHNLFMLLCDRLRAYIPMSLDLYEALIDLMIEENHPDRNSSDPERYQEISKKSIVNATVIKVIASLIHAEKKTHLGHSSTDQVDQQNGKIDSASDTRQLFISDLWNLIVNSRENRRVILQMSVWQYWLVNLIFSTIDDSLLVREQVLAIFRVLLYHGIRYELGGWRVWIDTLAIFHSKVSYDNFCMQIDRERTQLGMEEQAAELNKQLEQENKSIDTVDGKRIIESASEQATAAEQREVESSPVSVSNSKEASPSKQTAVVSSISEHVLNESRGIEIDEGHEDNTEVDEEKHPSSPETKGTEEAGQDNFKENLNKSEADTLADGVDSIDLAPSRAYRKKSVSENITTDQRQSPSPDRSNQLDRQQSLTSIPLDESSASPANDIIKSKEQCIVGEDSREEQVEPISNGVHQPSQPVEAAKVVDSHNTASQQGSSLCGASKAQASPAFRIPEFRWANILVKLLNDLLFSVECDLYNWRCLSSLTSLDTPPFAPKSSFAGGQTTQTSGFAPSGATSSSSNAQSATANNLAQLSEILQSEENQMYIVNVIHLVSQLADNVIIAAGGLLPLLADATGGSRASSSSPTPSDGCAADRTAAQIITSEGLTQAQANSLLYRLTAIVDMVIFAAPHVKLNLLEADKNTTCGGILRQCLRLACTVTVKNCLILRPFQTRLGQTGSDGSQDISLEFPKDMFDSYLGCSLLSANRLFGKSALTLENTDLIANLDYSPHQTPNTSSMPSLLPFQTTPIKDPSKLLQPLDISRIQACIYHTGNAESKQAQFLALSSLYFISVLMVSKYRDIIEPKQKISTSQKQGKLAPSISPETGETSSSTETKESVSMSASISSVNANMLSFGRMQPNASGPSASSASSTSSLTNMLTTRLENTLDSVCPLLKTIMCNFCPFLSRTLLGSHGQDLVNKEAERTFRRANTSPVELVMLLCSQEWQNTLQKNAGLAFIELINEGRVLSLGMKDHIVRVAMEAEFILSRLRADDVAKHEHFGLACSESLAARLHEEVLINSLITSAARRDHVLYCKFKESLASEWMQNYKLDIWEDDDRRKRRFVFDSWPNVSQLFYSLSNSAEMAKTSNNSYEETNGTTDSSQTEEKTAQETDDSRILDLQKTIELGGGLEECSPSRGPHSGGNDYEANFDDDDDEDDDDDDVEADEDCEENCDESNSPHSDSVAESTNEATRRNQPAGSRTPYGAERSRHFNKRRQVLNLKTNKSSSDGGPVGHSATESNDQMEPIEQFDGHQQQQSAGSQQQWDYEDYSSVNDFTGSVIFAAESSLVFSIYAIPGTLQITTNEIYFEPNQSVTDLIDALKRECQSQQDYISCTKSSKDHSAQFENQIGSQNRLRKVDLMALRYCDFLTTSNGKIQLADIRAIFTRHYLLQPNALEIFVAQRTSVMFAFNDFDIVKRVVKYLPPVGVGIKYGIAQSRRASLMSPRQLFTASNMTQRWQRREIGNFQYLMFLNTIAGRTYQDLNQYPVFPWILTNYESDELDLAMPTNFRDLSKPVGALNAKRRDEFIERYQSWDNPKVPAFHYGTHYSTAAFALNWMCRLRGPYNSSYLALQDGKYEEESRLFLSVGDSWVSSLVGGQQNVKELIPEFFYLPEMFHSNLGLPEVELPPWAKGSAEQFVRVHRVALESELVSCQLHQWIDLIFGYKQRGPEAISSINTFYYLTYQGNVNLNMIKEPALRDAIESQIKHFGQTPSQLTTEPHPPRFSALHAAPMAFSPTVDEINRVVKFPFNHSVVHISSCINNYIAAALSGSPGAADSPTTGTVQQGPGNASGSSSGSGAAGGHHLGPSSVLTITSNNQYQIHKWQSNEPAGHPFSIDPQLEGTAAPANRRQLIDVDDLCSNIYLELSSRNSGDTDDEDDTVDEVKWPCAHHTVTLNGKYIIMGSFYDNSFRVFTTESGKLCQVIYGHRAPITCLVRSEGNAVADFYIATGGQDCSLLIWFWNERYAQVEGSGVSAVHNPLPKLSITGHHTPVLSALISAELGLIISGSKNLILVHTTTSGDNLLQIDVKLSNIADRTLRRCSMTRSNGATTNQHQDLIQRPQVKDKQKTILEASMLNDPKDQQRALKQSDSSCCSISSQATTSTLSAKDERIAQLSELCASSDYYVTNLQLARELAFIACIALPAPKKRSSGAKQREGSTLKSSPPGLLLTFNLKGSLIDSAPIGLAGSSPKLGDQCVFVITRDGEHLILNDSPGSLKIYKTFSLQPVYAYNTNDIHPNASSVSCAESDNSRIRSLALLDHRFILVGLDNGKLIVYNCDFKNLQ